MSSLIVITRPGTAGQHLQQTLGVQGMNSLHLPGLMVECIDLPSQIPDQAQDQTTDSINNADWWLFTSPAAIACASHWLRRLERKSKPELKPRLKPKLEPGLKQYPAMAVLSEKSARQLSDQLDLDDQTNIICPANGHRSEDLLQHPKLQQLDGQRIIIFNAPGGRQLLADTLSERGAIVESFPVYNRQPAALDKHSVQQLADWPSSTLTLWTSNTAIDNLQKQLSSALWQKLMAGDHLSLSARQKIALEKVSTGKIYLAYAPDNASLQQQLVQLGAQG